MTSLRWMTHLRIRKEEEIEKKKQKQKKTMALKGVQCNQKLIFLLRVNLRFIHCFPSLVKVAWPVYL